MSAGTKKQQNREVVDALLAALEPLPVRARAMFGGFGLYMEDAFFGLISSEGHIYFRTDEFSRPDYESRGMGPFQPNNRPGGAEDSAPQFPGATRSQADPALLREWAVRAAGAQR